jgi:hypothetical protein
MKKEVATKTGVNLSEQEILDYLHIKGVVDRGFFVAYPIGTKENPKNRKRDLFQISCSKLVSLGLLKVVFDYGWGYAPTNLDLCDVVDETQDPGEYRYR